LATLYVGEEMERAWKEADVAEFEGNISALAWKD
jgi:hypothetical protein